MWVRPLGASSLVNEVGGDERREEHAFGTNEGPNGDLAIVEPECCVVAAAVRVAVAVTGVCWCCGSGHTSDGPQAVSAATCKALRPKRQCQKS